MPNYFSDRPHPTLTLLLLCIASVGVLFLLESHTGISLWDEGFLWYGAQRVMLGEVPMRDFMAYDIGRYYWSAALMSLWGGKGIVALRFAITIFQGIALYIGLSALARHTPKQNIAFWILATTILLAWLSPQFRVFDIALPIILVATLSFLIEQPTARRYFLTGLILGGVAIFGRNHGIYGVLGSLSVMAYLFTRRTTEAVTPIRAFAAWLLGVVVGYLPMLLLLVMIPGLAQAFGESILWLFEIKGTNLPLPVPWPWLVPFGKLSFIEIMRAVSLGTLFIAIIVFGVVGIAWGMRRRLQGKDTSPLLIAAIALTLPYAHYAYSRADIAHLAPGIPPFLMGVLLLLAMQSSRVKWTLMVLFVGVSLLVMLPTRYAWDCYAVNQCVNASVAGDRLYFDERTAGNLVILDKLAARFAPGDRPFIATPFWPGAYAALGKKSPMWDIYALFPRSEALQKNEIERIKVAKPGFVVINDFSLDKRESDRFRATHSTIDQYIRDEFVQLNVSSAGSSEMRIYKNKQAE